MTDCKFTDDAILRALGCLAGEDDIFCSQCVYQEYDSLSCKKRVSRDAYELIKSQTEQIIDLSDRNAKQRDVLHSYHINTLQINAITEFAEQYKAEVQKRYEDIAYKELFFGVIDSLIKERIENNDEH